MEILNNSPPKQTVWKNDLYLWQLKAPIPKPIHDIIPMYHCPHSLGAIYHGSISSVQALRLLSPEPNGAYLVRSSKESYGQFYTLSLKFNDEVHHYKLYQDQRYRFYIRQKKYENVKSLVADGLITMYLELKAPETLQQLPIVNYQESPYMTLNKRKLRVLNTEYARSKIFQQECAQIEVQEQEEKLEKSHVFKVNTFKGLNWCELCGNFLWGFTAQGVKCEDCGMIAHDKCSEKFPNDCVPDLKYLRGVFGIELTTLLTAHNASLPFVVTKCVTEVEARGLALEGIYRLSGFADEIEAIKLAFDKDGEKADLSQDKYQNVNVITGALKLYLRLLPIPLITFIAHPLLIDSLSHKIEKLQLISMRKALTSLPKAHYDTLRYVIQHLKRVNQHSAINKMNARNLATVFAPTLIGPPESLVSMLPDMTTDILLIENLILYCDEVFTDRKVI